MREKSKIVISVISFLIAVGLVAPVLSAVAAGSSPVDIWDWYDLHAVRNDPAGQYRLMKALDASTAGYTEIAGATANEGMGWQPIGTATDAFTGTFDGQGHEIADLYVVRPAENGTGLFGHVGPGAIIRAIGVVNASVTGDTYVGCLIGWNEGTVTNSYSSGSVTGQLSVGGLVGAISQGGVRNSYSAAAVSGDGAIGGLVGWNDGTAHNSYAIGDVIGSTSVGGLVGHNVGSTQGGTLTNSYSGGRVNGNERAGGLVGHNFRGVVSNCFWDTEASGILVSDGGIGKTTTEMKRIATFRDTTTDGLDQPWDITEVDFGEVDVAHTWNIVDGQSPPFLTPKPLIQYNLTISSGEGGQVTIPGEGTRAYDAGVIINLSAQAADGHRFTSWTGSVDTVGNANASATTITIHDNYTIMANFEEAPEVSVKLPLIGGTAAAVAIASLLAFRKHRGRPASTNKRR